MEKRNISILSLMISIIFAFSSQALACHFTNVNLIAECVPDGSGGYSIEYGITAETEQPDQSTGEMIQPPARLAYWLSISGYNIEGIFLSNSGPFVGSYSVQNCGDYIITGSASIVGTAVTEVLGPKTVICSCDGGTEGCTPGYWKNHLDMWTVYQPYEDFDFVFGTDLFDPDKTLGEAVRLGGGGIRKLARHGTAALLSAANSCVDYPYTVDAVIEAVRAGNADELADANELGCPLDNNICLQ